MMCERSESLQLRSWLNMLINDLQCSGGCGSDGDLVKMNDSCDPIDLLPDDPFEMNLVSEIDDGKTISPKIERWLECSTCDYKLCASDLDTDSGYYLGKPLLSSSETQVNSDVDFYEMGFSGSFLDVTGAGSFGDCEDEEEILYSGRRDLDGKVGTFGAMEEALFSGREFSKSDLNVTGDEPFGAFEDLKEVLVSGSGFSWSVTDVTGDGSFGDCEDVEEIVYSGRRDAIHPDRYVNCLHEGFLLSLGYLGVKDLLSVERVCRSLRYAVQNDPLLWRCIHIDSQLGEKITDDDLYRLTQKAQGSLECLSLVQCSKITNNGLKRVLDSNPMLKKLNVPGCIRLTAEGLINNRTTMEISGMPGIKSLKLGRHFIGSVEDFEELSLLVDAGEPLLTKARKLHFFHDGMLSLVCDDDIGINIEICPLCNKYRLLFDCPSESCRNKEPDHCRACAACIERCAYCGRCLGGCKYIETFFFNNICLVCANRSSDSQDILEEKGVDAYYKF